MEFILDGAILIVIVGAIFFGYQYIRRVGLRCVSDEKKTCVGDTISQFYSAEDQQKDSAKI